MNENTIGETLTNKKPSSTQPVEAESCRDLGFNTILTFFSKLSAGTGEQLLTRQVLRLGHELDLPEFLTFYYAHAGWNPLESVGIRWNPLEVGSWGPAMLQVVQDVVERSDKNV